MKRSKKGKAKADQPMRTMRLAVFGHYDSRGGTAAVRINAFTKAEVEKAKAAYNLDMFGITEAEERIETTAYGMPAREVDKLVHEMMYRGTTPGEEDFLYVATLHYERMADLEGDLDWSYSEPRPGQGYRNLVVSESEEPDENPEYRGEPQPEPEPEPPPPPDPTDIEQGLEHRNLELVTMPADWDEDIQADRDNDTKDTNERMKRASKPGVWWPSIHGSSSDESAEVKRMRDLFHKREDGREREMKRRMRDATRVIKDARFYSWGDDAFGFIIVDLNVDAELIREAERKAGWDPNP